MVRALTNWLPSVLHFGLEFTGLFFAINAKKNSDTFELAVMAMSYWNFRCKKATKFSLIVFTVQKPE
jgi:hypothetical protein